MNSPTLKQTLLALGVVLFAVVLIASPALATGVTTYQDQTFNDSEWSAFEYWDTGNNATLTASQAADGSNVFRRVEHDWASGTIAYLHLRNGVTYDPAVQGAVASIAFSYDVESISGFYPGAAKAYNVLLLQDGHYYMYAPDVSHQFDLVRSWDTSWVHFAHTGATASDFHELTYAPPDAVDWSVHPDFSANGSALQFGFVTANDTAFPLDLVSGIDDWEVSVTRDAPSILAPYDPFGLAWGDATADGLVLFNTGNVYGVSYGPGVPATFTILEPYTITSISTYHFGSGATPGTIGLLDESTGTYVGGGPWSAGGLYYNYYWYVRPNITIGPGTYTLVDSSPSTWACTPGDGSLSAGMGFTRILRSIDAPPADTTPPVITVPADITVEATGPSGAAVTFAATAEDLVDGPVAVASSPTSGSAFPLGTTTVCCSATDEAGNTAYAYFTVTVEDTTAPTITVSVTPDVLWPPNHKMVAITALVSVADLYDAHPAVVLTSITSSEPDDAPGNGDGATVDDIQGALLGTMDFRFFLRAERAGSGDGRIYTITYAVTDASGNTANGVATVTVPHSR